MITRPPLSRQSGILVLKVQIKGVRGFKGACNSNVRTTTLPVSGSGFRMAAYNRSILFGLRPQNNRAIPAELKKNLFDDFIFVLQISKTENEKNEKEKKKEKKEKGEKKREKIIKFTFKLASQSFWTRGSN